MFEKLIEAARTCHESGNPIDECCIECCPNFDSQPYCLDQILKDCVEALTQSSAELKDKDYLIQQQAEEIERLRRDVKKQQEKMFELAKKLPKRGEWIPIQIGKWRGHKCSNCGISFEVPCSNDGIPQWKYCHECGARMDGKEAADDKA